MGTNGVCLDDLISSLSSEGKCLVYSFGISHDPSFEYAMARAGCNVWGYDHTVNVISSNPLFKVFKTGIQARKELETRNLKTLETLMKANGHDNITEIHFLKVTTLHFVNEGKLT